MGDIAYNIPAVLMPRKAASRGLAARIRALRRKTRPTNYGEEWRENGALRNDLAIAEAGPPTNGEAYTVLSGAVFSALF